MKRVLVSGCVASLFLAGSALAGVSDFLGQWVNAGAKDGSFLGDWVGSGGDNSEIVRIVVTPAGVNAVRLHLYGRCSPECDWGSQLGHNRSSSPDSGEVESISADFNTTKFVKHLTLRKGPGGSLHFSVATDFTDHSGRHDYEVAGTLRRAPAAVARATAPMSTAPSAVPAPAAMTAAATDFSEDCVKINPEDIFVAPNKRGWAVRDYNHVILDYGSDKLGAAKAARVLEYYRFDEQCYVVRPRPKMIYWRIAGRLPRDSMPGEDCVDVNPKAVTVKAGKVVDNGRMVIDFDGDTTAATQAASVIRTYGINRQCFVARPSDKMVYWLSK